MLKANKFISLDGKTLDEAGGVHELGDFDISGVTPYNTIEEIPGMDKILELEAKGENTEKYTQSLDQIHSIEYIKGYCKLNLNNPRLCVQVVDTQTAGKIVWGQVNWKGATNKRYPSAAFGFKTVKLLGMGKDGATIMCEKYLESKANKGNKYILKVWSPFAKEFVGNTKILSWLMGFHVKENPIPSTLLRYTVKSPYMSYFTPKVDKFHECSADPEQWMMYISQICNTQKWMIDNWGILFWDWGFDNGRNYVLDHKNRVKWIDYGGIGIYVTDKFDNLNITFNRGEIPPYIQKAKESHAKNLSSRDKTNIGHSRQIMMSFLFHIEFWYCKYKAIEPTVQYYSSLVQTGPKIMMELNHLLPTIFNYIACREIYEEFEDADWTAAYTWKAVGSKITTLFEEGKIK